MLKISSYGYFMTTSACFIILGKNYNGHRTVSGKVLTLAVATEPTFHAIKHSHV